MRSLLYGHKTKVAVLLWVCLTAGACAHQSGRVKAVPAAKPPPATPTPAPSEPLVKPQPLPEPIYTGPLQLHEVRVITASGQRNVVFRFSRPPEDINYFPLREPSRIVIDIKGPIESLPQVAIYKADDPLIEAVRVGSYEGRMRLVVDVAAEELPQFSVQSGHVVLTATLGEKAETAPKQKDAQVLFIAENARLDRLAQAPPVVDRLPAPPRRIEESSLAPASHPDKMSHPLASTPLQLAQAEPPAAPAPSASDPIQGRALSGRKHIAPEFAPAQPQYIGQKISLDFKNADVHDVLRILADVSGLNLVSTDDVKGKITLRLVDVPWDQALAVVLQANGLEKIQSGNVVTISTTQRLGEERSARLKAQEAQQKLAPLETVYVKINYVKSTDLVSLIGRQSGSGKSGGAAKKSGKSGRRGGGTQVALLSPRGTIAADETSNVVIIRDVRENIGAIQELIKNIDVQTPQVLIESYIVTVSENINRSLGIQWGYQHIASPETGNPTGLNFPGRIGIGGAGNTGTGGIPFIADFPATAGASTLDLFLGSLDGTNSLTARLSALESEGKARVISRPRVVTLNNGEALIKSRREVRVPVTSGNLTVGGAGTSGGGDAFEEFDVGITLKVTPQISSDGYVLLEIQAESSALADSSVTTTAASSTVPSIPDVLSRTTNSTVLIRAGATFVLGGILQDSLDRRETGIPYLRDTPGIGWLFKGKDDSRTKDELLIFLTPTIVAGVSTTTLPSASQLWENRPVGEVGP